MLKIRHLTRPGLEPVDLELAKGQCTALSGPSGAGKSILMRAIADLDPRVGVILDLKAPGSGEESRNLWDNLPHLKSGDELKIVIADRTDYEWARDVYREHRPTVPTLFSPVFDEMEPAQLSQWLIEDQLPVRMQLQQHKYIWDPEARRT